MNFNYAVVSFVVVLVVVVSMRTLLLLLTSLPWPDSASHDYHHPLSQTAHEIDVGDQQSDDDEEFDAANNFLKRLMKNQGRSFRNYDIPRISENNQVKYKARVLLVEEEPGNRRQANVTENRSHLKSLNHQGLEPRLTESPESPALRLQRLLTRPTTSCRRLVRVGGRSCLRAYDGSKLLCLDEDVKLRPFDCLLYSFGVGNDFTFDEHMQDFGCEVHAFDHDNDHEIYDYRLGPTAFFHKSRIGFKTGYFRFCEQTPSGRTCEPAIRYQTMADIRRTLGHEDRRLHYLKMDIEGGEWEVLHQVLLNTTLLSTVSQVTLEIHLEKLRSEKTPEGKRAAVAFYLDVIQGLLNLGFQLVSHDENGLNPQYETVDGVQLSLYAELLFIRRNHNVKII